MPHQRTYHLYAFVEDIAIRADRPSTLTDTLNQLHGVAHHMGLCFNKDKTEVYHWSKHYAPDNLTWCGPHLGPPLIPGDGVGNGDHTTTAQPDCLQ